MIVSILQFIFWASLILIGYSYFLYPVILLIWDKVRPVKEGLYSSDMPGVSIIISAYNEEQVIEHRIKNCLELDYPADKLEIIVASDGSSDATCAIARKIEDGRLKIEEFTERRGKVNVLNAVAPKAQNEIIVFSDANTLFKRDAIKNLVHHFEDPHIGCVCGRLQFVNVEGSNSSEMEGVYWRYETFMKTIEGRRGYLLGANGGIYAIRKELFVTCPPDTIVEDFVLPMKILEGGHKVLYDPEAIAVEETAKHIIQEKKRRIRIGAGNFQALVMLTHMLNPLRGFPALAFLSHKVLRWLTPFFMITAFGANVFLRFDPIYRTILFLQLGFYMCAFLGQMLSWGEKNIKPFNLCYYFVSMNLALLLGFVRYMTGEQKVTWERTER